jgi:hypothetical protein
VTLAPAEDNIPCLQTVFISYQLLLGVVQKFAGYEKKAFTNDLKSRF